MTAGKKKLILAVWLIISIAALASQLIGMSEYFSSVRDETISSVVMQPESDFAGPYRLFAEQYMDMIKKSVIYLVINIVVTIFVLANIK